MTNVHNTGFPSHKREFLGTRKIYEKINKLPIKVVPVEVNESTKVKIMDVDLKAELVTNKNTEEIYKKQL